MSGEVREVRYGVVGEIRKVGPGPVRYRWGGIGLYGRWIISTGYIVFLSQKTEGVKYHSSSHYSSILRNFWLYWLHFHSLLHLSPAAATQVELEPKHAVYGLRY